MTFSLGAGQTALIFLVLLRSAGFVFAAPIFGNHAIPMLVKFGLAGALTVALLRTAGAAAGTTPLLLAAPIELVIGLSLGYVLSLCFRSVELVGRLISIQLGLSLGAVFNPTQEEASTPIDPFFSVLAGLLFLAMGLHLALVRALAQSFVLFPLGGGWPVSLASTAVQATTTAIDLGVGVALPIALILLLTELAVALLARAIPQINVFILGLPLKMLVGFAVLAMAMPGLVAGAAAIYRVILRAATGGAVSG